ncbi:hypothetical protein [Candidatus Nitrososphaera evergladensis]|uniref:hypothetical protein n=1 Tax=Candidatus Nitrososphaera evergladensis TaxID=1459637 RepID=UPI0011E58C7E|nr:hypothetical protein [Candidatus Nitrososphaera evergladensis]
MTGITISVVWGISFAGSFLKENTIVAKTTIEPGRSVDARANVNQLGKPLSLAIGIDKSGQQQQAFSDIRLKETITDPTGKVVSSHEFGESFFNSFNPQIAGIYTVTVSNLGTQPVSVSGAFGYMSFVGSDGKPNINAIAGEEGGLGMVIAGGGLAAAGIIALIVGAIITVIDSRAQRQGSTKASENGISYKKD